MSLTTHARATGARARTRRSLGLWILVIVVALPAAATAAPARPPVPGPPPGDSGTAGAALLAARGLADGAPGTALIDSALADDLGYTPVPELGVAARSDGDCSSPVPLPLRFEPACRVHDLGYDLLRAADRQGVAIPARLRSDLDSLLAHQMRASCAGDVPCLAMARVAHMAVHVNTVRQGHGAPVEERLPW